MYPELQRERHSLQLRLLSGQFTPRTMASEVLSPASCYLIFTLTLDRHPRSSHNHRRQINNFWSHLLKTHGRNSFRAESTSLTMPTDLLTHKRRHIKNRVILFKILTNRAPTKHKHWCQHHASRDFKLIK